MIVAAHPAFSRSSIVEQARVLLIEPDPQSARALSRTLRSIVGSVEVRDSLEGASLDHVDIVALAADRIVGAARADAARTVLAHPGRPRLLWIASSLSRVELAEMFERRQLMNLVARNAGHVDPSELIATLRKLLEPGVFGLDKYFAWGVESIGWQLTSSTQKDGVIVAAEEYAVGLGVQGRLALSFATVVDEFVTNAIYNAPVARDGRPRYAHLARDVEVTLDPHETVTARVCCDGERLGVAVRDGFGSITADRIVEYMAKCFGAGNQLDDKDGGAGVGLHQAFSSLSSFVVNIERGVRTEFIGIIDIRGTYRDFAMRGKSFNVFAAG